MSDARDTYLPPDTIVLLNAGIDIGTATSQMLVSRLVLKRLGRAHSSRYIVVSRETVFDSPVVFTPYEDTLTIDSAKLIATITEWLDDAAHVGAIESGVVLLTGEAVRRTNAEAIAIRIGRLAGDFVCAAAGDLFEARMAAMGSGAIERSRQVGRVLNIDIGGGTTKLSVIQEGKILESSVVRVGSRGIVTDGDRTVTRLEISGRLACEALELPIAVGNEISEATLQAVSDWMVSRIDEHIFGMSTADPAVALRIMPPLRDVEDINGVVFSSGVAEYIHKRTTRDYDDLGKWLAQAVDERIKAGRWNWKSLPIENPLRATALGISQYTVEVSGDTIFVGDNLPLPIRNRKVVSVDLTGIEGSGVAEAMAEAAAGTDIESVKGGIAWKLKIRIGRRYKDVAAFAQALGGALVRHDDGPSVVILNEDVAMTVGRLISDELSIKQAIVVLDGVFADVEFLDVGRQDEDSATVPIILKSFVFKELREDVGDRGSQDIWAS